MQKIDELEGVALDIAVAEAIGREIERRENGRPLIRVTIKSESYTAAYWDVLPNYSDDISAAWTIGNELSWEFEECHDWQIKSDYVYATAHTNFSNHSAIVYYEYEDSNRAHAYATARCRAWLKAVKDSEEL